MHQFASKRSFRAHALSFAAAVLALGLYAPVSDAHFTLQTPPSWRTQDGLGSPQKAGPCGDEAGGTSTGAVTAYQVGHTITVTIDEKIFHPGHYRIALAVNDRSELPAEPTVTPNATPCGTVPIESPPVFPVLADGVFPHTEAFSAPQSVELTLPAGVTCTHCTLQVIEFMSDHPLNVPGGCFYHHCADISIQTTPVIPMDGGAGGAAGSSTGAGAGDVGPAPSAPQSSSGCATSSRGEGSFPAGLLAWPPSSASAAVGAELENSRKELRFFLFAIRDPETGRWGRGRR